MLSSIIPHRDDVPEQPRHSSASFDCDEFQKLQREDGHVVVCLQVLEPNSTRTIPCDSEKLQDGKFRVAAPSRSIPQFSQQTTMLGLDNAENDALCNVVRNILQLQKRQVELYEAQLRILGRHAHMETVSNATKLSEKSQWNGENESDSFADSKVGGAAAPNVFANVVCDQIDVVSMDAASPAPDTEQRMESSKPQPCQGSRSVKDYSGPLEMTATHWLGYCHMDSKALLTPEFHDILPSDMALATRNTLIFLGAVPATVFEQGFWRALYRLYRCFIIVSLVFVATTSFAGGLLQAWAGLFPVEFVYFIYFGAIAPVVIVTTWQQLGRGGAYLDMLHQLSRRRFDWKLFDRSVYVLWCSVSITEAALALLACILRAMGELTINLPESAEDSSSLRHFERVFEICVKCSAPFTMFIVAIGFSSIWCYWMFADMHRCDVLDYGTVLASVMEEGKGIVMLSSY